MIVLLVIGTRPQIIKSAPIINESKNWSEVELLVVHTGQHYDYEMSKVFFNELRLPDPTVNLGVGSGTHAQQTASMMVGLEKSYNELKPDLVLVPGDTNSTIAGALTAAKMHIPLAHVESGARSYDMRMPEEVNRILTDYCSSRLYTVSKNCVKNLVREGIHKDEISLVGDTMYESVINHKTDIEKEDAPRKYGLEPKRYAVLTLHRAENTDDLNQLGKIIDGVTKSDITILFPCHPRTKQKLVDAGLINRVKEHCKLLEPLPYYEMLSLIKDSGVTITDSGGLQKEAYWLGSPCVTLRENTEWIETVKSKGNHLVGSDPVRIIRGIKKALKEGFPNRSDSSDLLIPRASMNILKDIVHNFPKR